MKSRLLLYLRGTIDRNLNIDLPLKIGFPDFCSTQKISPIVIHFVIVFFYVSVVEKSHFLKRKMFAKKSLPYCFPGKRFSLTFFLNYFFFRAS